jgi:hypothetical protein
VLLTWEVDCTLFLKQAWDIFIKFEQNASHLTAWGGALRLEHSNALIHAVLPLLGLNKVLLLLLLPLPAGMLVRPPGGLLVLPVDLLVFKRGKHLSLGP